MVSTNGPLSVSDTIYFIAFIYHATVTISGFGICIYKFKCIQYQYHHFRYVSNTLQASPAISKGNTCREMKKISFCIGERLRKNLEERNNYKIGVDWLKSFNIP